MFSCQLLIACVWFVVTLGLKGCLTQDACSGICAKMWLRGVGNGDDDIGKSTYFASAIRKPQKMRKAHMCSSCRVLKAVYISVSK